MNNRKTDFNDITSGLCPVPYCFVIKIFSKLEAAKTN